MYAHCLHALPCISFVHHTTDLLIDMYAFVLAYILSCFALVDLSVLHQSAYHFLNPYTTLLFHDVLFCLYYLYYLVFQKVYDDMDILLDIQPFYNLSKCLKNTVKLSQSKIK